jgi:hypothetical protein
MKNLLEFLEKEEFGGKEETILINREERKSPSKGERNTVLKLTKEEERKENSLNRSTKKTEVTLKPSVWDATTIASYLWKDSKTIISGEMVKKVRIASEYLASHGYQIAGVKADGNCFFSAFLESYNTLSREIPLLDREINKIHYLRDTAAKQYESSPQGSKYPDRADIIKKDSEWVNISEGGLLAKALDIPIRVMTVNSGQVDAEVDDMLIFPAHSKENQQWATFAAHEKPTEYIFIVDVGGHFLWAKKKMVA